MDVKAFPFNYNRSQPGSPSASAFGGGGPGKRFYRRSATVVRTSALKPPLKFAELFICLAPAASMFVPTSYRPFFSEKLKISESFSSCPLSPPFAPSFCRYGFFFRVIWLRDFFSFGLSIVLHALREGAANRKCLIYLMQCLQLLSRFFRSERPTSHPTASC